VCTGGRRLIGSFKLQIIFRKRATKYRSLLRKMNYEDQGSYESSPPCRHLAATFRYGKCTVSTKHLGVSLNAPIRYIQCYVSINASTSYCQCYVSLNAPIFYIQCYVSLIALIHYIQCCVSLPLQRKKVLLFT